MAGPPANVSPSDLFVKLSQSPKPKKRYVFPRKDETGQPIGEMYLVPLSEKELMQCRALADEYARMMLKSDKPSGDSLGYQDIYRNALFVEFVVRACRSVQDEELRLPVFPTAQAVRDLMPDEIAVLFEAASDWQTECGPIVTQMTNAELENWIDVLAKGASDVPLDALSSGAKKNLIRSLARRLASSSTPIGSAGAPQGGSSPKEGETQSEVPPQAGIASDEVPASAVKD